ncbi:carboxypeptidase [Geomicrobium sp. JCM 19037]|uniref:M14 family zinc carboxypeptidase n=1 Tax=Geomicrobium sp. JCM 19037 TaxID=1460634 RepID=UPI00045F3D81|nr:M14 family zinc carboxypeptidase [Geomicrobium sp. JCM 19037]GAK03906.1 carboxypeptidase [Geomicrobium sp. JCM 19037]
MHWKRVVPMAAMLAVLPANMAAADSPEEALEKMDRILEIEKEDTGDGQVMMRSTNFDPSEWIRYDDLLPELERIAELSDGELDIDVLGQSQRGRDIYSTRIGTGDEVILITSEIHGNENFGTESLVSLLETLATSDEEEVQFILDEITVVAVPKFNGRGGTCAASK